MNLSGSRISLNGALGASLLAIGITALLVLFGLATLITAAVGGGTGGITPEKDVSKLVAAHKEQQKVYVDRINGRSAFYKPTPPPKVIETPTTQKSAPPPPPPPPAGPDPTYRGPSPRFRVGDTVWFAPPSATEKPFAVSVGEIENGVKLLAVKGAWTIRVGYKGGEYDVDLGPKLSSSIETSLPAKAKPAPKLAALEEVRGIPLVPGTGAAMTAKEASGTGPASSKPAGESAGALASSPSVAIRPATGPTTNAAPGVEGEPPDQADPDEESQEPAVEHPKDPATVTNDPEPASDEPPPPPRRRVPPPPPTS